MYPVRCEVLTRARPDSPVARGRSRRGNFPALSGPTTSALGGEREETGRNMCEPRCSLVSPHRRRRPCTIVGKSAVLVERQGWARTSPGVSGATRLDGTSRNRRDPLDRSGLRPISKDSEMVEGIRRESDKAVVVMKPRTNNLGRAKGLDLSDVLSKRKGSGDWR